MHDLQVSPDTLLHVNVKLGRPAVAVGSPTRVQVLVETRPNTQTRGSQEPIEFRFVIDVSGSMADSCTSDGTTKLEVVKRAALALIKKLNPKDSILVSVFSTGGRLIVPTTVLSAPGAKETIKVALKCLQPDASTNISAGLSIALETPPVGTKLTRVVLFTDGQSSWPDKDHLELVDLADQARDLEIPLSIYGTGSDYKWSLLQQLAVRAGSGSFLVHVMNVAELEGHLLGELSFLRGTAIDRLTISGTTPDGVELVSVTSMMPLIRELKLQDPRSFEDNTGALDIHRGAQLLIELEVQDPQAGMHDVLTLTFEGRSRSTLDAFRQEVTVQSIFVANAMQASPVDEDVRKVMLMVAGAKQADQGRYQQAADLYRRAGDDQTAIHMETLHASSVAGGDQEDLRRGASSMTSRSVTQVYTVDPSDRKKP